MGEILKRLVVICVLAAVSGVLGSCIPLAAGAAGGYILHKEGYRLQNPVIKSERPAPRAEVIPPEG